LEIGILGQRCPATITADALYDPENKCARGE